MTLSVQHLYDARHKNGMYSFFESTKLEQRNADEYFGFEGVDSIEEAENQLPCLICGPGYIPSLSGYECIPLQESQKLRGCSVYYRNPYNPTELGCMMCTSHYYVTKFEATGGAACSYGLKKAMCLDPDKVDENGNC